MKAALIGALSIQDELAHSIEADLVIAVDAGWRVCRDAHIAVDVAIGDFDSLGYVPEAPQLLTFPSRKNESDMELALRYACEQGADEVYIYGAFAKRLDHTLANLQLMLEFAWRGVRVLGIGDDCAIAALAAGDTAAATAPHTLRFEAFNPVHLSGEYAPYLSIMTFFGPSEGLTIEGLAYEVSDFTLPVGSSRGLSNEFIGQRAHITLKQGSVVVIFPLDALEHAAFEPGALI